MPDCRFMSGRAEPWRFRCASTMGHRSTADWEAWEQEYIENVMVDARPAAEPDDFWGNPLMEDRQHTFLDWENLYGGTAGTGSI